MKWQVMSRKVMIEESWKKALTHVFSDPFMDELRSFLQQEQQQYQTYPPNKEIFAAMDLTPLPSVKVVILGQDPYHGPRQAHGLSFSVQKGVKPPPSLQNIFQELADDLGCTTPQSGDLRAWARQGVLLLNTVLTVRARQAGSHRGKGWERFTDEVIKAVNQSCEGVVFILWGKDARSKKPMIDSMRHTIIESTHPSPYSARYGFFNSRPFSRTNQALQQAGKSPIQWCLSD